MIQHTLKSKTKEEKKLKEKKDAREDKLTNARDPHSTRKKEKKDAREGI
ncbi:MAG: hypothetical protein ACQESC_01130 [Nanobdellota archaeon]